MKKGGISTVVATVLIILITIAAVAIIWAAIIPLIQTSLNVVNYDGRVSIATTDGYTAYDPTTETLYVQVEQDGGEKLSEIRLIVEKEGNLIYEETFSAPGINVKKVYSLSLVGLGVPDSVKVAPIFVDGTSTNEGNIMSSLSDIPLTTVSGGSSCGDGTCSAGESCSTCSSDCGICPLCGNGAINAGEQCDGTNLNGQTCVLQGFTGGSLACSGSCQFNTASCTSGSLCGNEAINAGEQCDDGNVVAADGCSASCRYEGLRVSFNMNGGGYVYEDLTSVTDYTILSGSCLEYDIYWTSISDRIAFDYTAADGENLRDSGAVQNGYFAHPNTILPAFNQWYSRMIPIPSAHNSKTIVNYDIVCESDEVATKTSYIRNIRITDCLGTTRKLIYNGGAYTHGLHFSGGGTVNSFGSGYVSLP